MTNEPTRDPKSIVRRGYDAISYVYRGDEEDENCRVYHGWLDELLPEVPPGAAVLELGCGNGVPVARRLARAYALTGVDISEVQIERARKNVQAAPGLPEPLLVTADMTALTFPGETFAAVLAFYALIHVPLAEQPALLRSIHGWLQPRGVLMATVGHTAWTGTEENWLDGGATMYWSHSDADTYRSWLEEIGFTLRWTRFVPEGQGGHTLLLAQKSAA